MTPRRTLRSLLAALFALVACAVPAVAGAAPTVYPGAVLRSDVGQCTDNFLFQGSDGNRYIGSAGHCVLNAPDVGGANVGEQTWAPGQGPVARDNNGNRIGQFVYAILQDPKDFSLIKLDDSVLATPQMPTFGGPTGVDNDLTSSTVLLQYYGEGILVSNIAPGREAVAFGTPDPDHVYAQGIVVPGDSGSAIETSDGRAVGVIVTVGVNSGSVGTSGVDAGPMGITRLSPQLARASQVLGIGLTLRTAPLLNGSPSSVVAPTAGNTSSQAASGRGAGGSSSTSTAHRHTARHHRKAKRHKSRHSAKHAKHAHSKHAPARSSQRR